MALINIDALAGLNDFNRESLYERLCNAINPLIVTNKKYEGRLEDDLVIVEGNKVATEKGFGGGLEIIKFKESN